jgi:HYR domain
VTYSASAHDLVDGNVGVTCTPAAGTSFAVGTTTVTCTAKDAHGNAASGTFHVTVNYAWTGFFEPIANNAVNSVKAGSAVPVKFSLGSNQGMNILSATTPNPKLSLTSCNGGQQATTQTVTAGGSSLSYDPTANQYVYVWKTDKAWAAKCGRLDVALTDGTIHSASFSFK